MARIAVNKTLSFSVEYPVEERDKLSVCDVPTQESIHLAAEDRGMLRFIGKSSHSCLHIGHQKRSRDAFSGDVCDADAQLVVSQPENVEVVSTHSKCRMPGRGDFKSC